MRIIRDINRCDVFVGIWALYNLQDIIYPRGILNQLLQLVMILFILYDSYHVWRETHSEPLIRATIVLFIMYLIYGIFLILFPPGTMKSGTYTYIQYAIISLLPILMFYSYTLKGYLTEQRMCVYLLLMIPIVYIVSQHNYQEMLLEAITNRTEFTDNTGYMYLALIPLVGMFYRKPVLQYVLFGVIFFLILSSMKRGAILIAVLCLFCLVYVNYRKGSSKKIRLYTFLLSTLAIIASLYFFEYMIENSDYFVQRFDSTLEGNTSGRDVLFTKAWDGFWNSSNIFYIIFGHGARSTYADLGNYAHQDWLEMLYSNGIVGFSVLLYFFIVFFRTVYKHYKYSPDSRTLAYIMLFIVCFSKTMFSMSIMELEISQTMLVGYMLAFKASQNTVSTSQL